MPEWIIHSSSVCVYRDMQPGEPELAEDEAIPAHPDNEYGWEKLYAERAPWNTLLYGPHLERIPYSTGRVAMAYGRHYDMNVGIARFQNRYGPEGAHSLRSVQAWRGGREKAPAAICA